MRTSPSLSSGMDCEDLCGGGGTRLLNLKLDVLDGSCEVAWNLKRLGREFDDGEAVVFEAESEGIAVPAEDFASEVTEVEGSAASVDVVFGAESVEFLIFRIRCGEAFCGMGKGGGDAELRPVEGDGELLVVVVLGEVRDDCQHTQTVLCGVATYVDAMGVCDGDGLRPVAVEFCLRDAEGLVDAEDFVQQTIMYSVLGEHGVVGEGSCKAGLCHSEDVEFGFLLAAAVFGKEDVGWEIDCVGESEGEAGEFGGEHLDAVAVEYVLLVVEQRAGLLAHVFAVQEVRHERHRRQLHAVGAVDEFVIGEIV